MAEAQDDRYRVKYLELLREVDEKEKEWAEVDGRLRRILSHLSIIAEGPSTPETLAALEKIRESLKKGLDLTEIEGLVDVLRQRVLRESKWVEEKVDFPPLHQILIHLVERLPLPAEMTESTVKVVERLEAGIGPGGLPEAIDEISGLVLQVRSRMLEEKRELEGLLKEITGRLVEFDHGLTAAHEEATAGFASNRTLDKAVRAEMEGLEVTARRSEGVEGLRSALSRSLEAIRSHLAVKTEEDLHREETLRAEVSRLQQNIGKLEKELDEHREKAKAAREASYRDPLTGCFNRLAYQERAKAEEARWQRHHHPLSLLVFDIDHFKRINDSFGHRAGDQVLKAIAQIANAQIRQSDFFGRFGGEEFVALLPETRAPQAVIVAEKVRVAVESFRFHFRGERVPITLCCGVAEFSQGDNLEKVFERADKALYAAKNGGRNRTEQGA